MIIPDAGRDGRAPRERTAKPRERSAKPQAAGRAGSAAAGHEVVSALNAGDESAVGVVEFAGGEVLDGGALDEIELEVPVGQGDGQRVLSRADQVPVESAHSCWWSMFELSKSPLGAA